MKTLLSYRFLIPLAVLLGLAPFYPQPHLAEKIDMLIAGTLAKPIDLFDLFWHTWPLALLAWKGIMDVARRNRAS